MALYEEESKKARIFQREKRQELQLIIDRVNKIPFSYVCTPLQRNDENVVFGSSIARKIHLFASDKSVNSYERRCFNEHFPESPRALAVVQELNKHDHEVHEDHPTFPFSSKVPRFQDFTALDASQGYRRKKKVQEVPASVKISYSAFGTSSRRDLMITRDKIDETLPGPGTTTPFTISKKQIVHHSFGGPTHRHPAYEIICSPKNLDTKCHLCEGEVKNVYWKNPKTQIVYCRKCYNAKVLEIKNKNKGVLDRLRKLNVMENDFRKMRHCEFIHEHNNTKAKILLLSPKEIQKRLNRENYFSTRFKY